MKVSGLEMKGLIKDTILSYLAARVTGVLHDPLAHGSARLQSCRREQYWRYNYIP